MHRCFTKSRTRLEGAHQREVEQPEWLYNIASGAAAQKDAGMEIDKARQFWGLVDCLPAWAQGDVSAELRLHPPMSLYRMQGLLLQVCCLHHMNTCIRFLLTTQLLSVLSMRDMMEAGCRDQHCTPAVVAAGAASPRRPACRPWHAPPDRPSGLQSGPCSPDSSPCNRGPAAWMPDNHKQCCPSWSAGDATQELARNLLESLGHQPRWVECMPPTERQVYADSSVYV